MKRIVLLLILIALVVFQTLAQKKIQPPAPKPASTAPAQPKGPIPYLLKKDFELIQTEMNAKIKAAGDQAVAAKQTIQSKLAQVTELNNKMTQVEEILNSANFKISLQSDSLKSTQMLLEEMKAEEKAHFEMMQAENAALKSKDSTLMMIIGAMGLLIIVLLFWQINGLKKSIASQFKTANGRMEAELNKMDQENRESISNASSKMQSDLNYLKTDMSSSQARNLSQLQSTLTERATADKDSLTKQLIALHDQIEHVKEQINELKKNPNHPEA